MYLIFLRNATLPKSTIDKAMGIAIKKDNRKVIRKFELQTFLERVYKLAEHYKDEMPDEKPVFIKHKTIKDSEDIHITGLHYDVVLYKLNPDPATLR